MKAKTLSLRQKQHLLMRLLPGLLNHAFKLGYELTIGDGYRDPRLHGNLGEKKGYGHPRSAHKSRLAIDLNLFRNGEYLEGTEEHAPLGEWWEKQHELCRWGGRFGDGNHYSIEHEGMK